MKLTITYESEEVLERVMQSPMTSGMEMGYERLEALLNEMEGK